MTHYLADHSHFTSMEDMDMTVKLHIITNWNAMNTTDRNILDVIHRYSAKYGAAHLKHSTIEHLVGRSNSAVRRSILKLEQLGIIDRIHYIRPVMNGLGANIYGIRPFETN